jgi:hypothetical protein
MFELSPQVRALVRVMGGVNPEGGRKYNLGLAAAVQYL